MNRLKYFALRVNRCLITHNRCLTLSVRNTIYTNQHNKLFKNNLSTASPQDIVIPEPPLPPVFETALNVLNEPTFASLGLNSYWPSGWYQLFAETLHVTFDLPWWAVIFSSTIIIRICILPFSILQRRKLVETTNCMPQITMMQQKLSNARLSSDNLEILRISYELREFMGKNNVNPFNSMKFQIIQIPVLLSVYTGLNGMTNVPVPSLQTGGLMWFTDLTVCDPYCILPLLCASSIFLLFEFNHSQSVALTPATKLMFRIFPIGIFFFIMNQPAAVAWYWTISNSISFVQSQALQIKYVQKLLNLPEPIHQLSQTSTGPKKGFFEGMKESISNTRILAELESRERFDAKMWQKSGTKNKVTTFKNDPTKPISTTGEFVKPKSKSTA